MKGVNLMLYRFVTGRLTGISRVLGSLYFNMIALMYWLTWNSVCQIIFMLQDLYYRDIPCFDFISYSEAKESIREAIFLAKELES